MKNHKLYIEKNKEKFDYVIALAGNPNTGKSTVFNNLTGLHQHTGNWPGKTVTRAVGLFDHGGKRFKVVDLPGTYSLLAVSEDEILARDFIIFGRPDVTVIVVDATCLERNLNLVIQVLQITDCAVVDLNLMDEARRNNLKINHSKLSKLLGVPVVPTSARYNEGMEDLIAVIHQVAEKKIICRPFQMDLEIPALNHAINQLEVKVRKVYPELPNAKWVALRLLDGDPGIIDAFRNDEFREVALDFDGLDGAG